ncbi:hypothetical protein GWI72_10335 [Microvirga tunisiensis]|uniref:Uncharacterized protein n=1 Tax=Pannonibacter tanglangensis TaxID=2750084 RepID=A0A7X5F2P3_9HYPH|nr:hypothetical protein [Pannonibacter sp. XCT-53]NBN78663.1 hypothetical protein [Pannonibacter sp. XCT-53]
MTPQHYLTQALIIRAIARDDPERPLIGAPLLALRRQVAAGEHAEHPAALTAEAVRQEIMRLGIGDMPPATDLVATLLETLSQRLGGNGYKSAWEAIGIKPTRGRDLLARSANAVDWPIWKTLRDAALAD